MRKAALEFDVYDIKDKQYIAKNIKRKELCELINIESSSIRYYIDKGKIFYDRYIIVSAGGEVEYKEVVNISVKQAIPPELLKEWDRVTEEAREYINSRKVMACNN